MNSEMQFLPDVYSYGNQVRNPDERIFGRPFGFGFGLPFLGGLLAGSLLAPWGGFGYPYGGFGYSYPYPGYGFGYPYEGFGGFGGFGCC